MWGALSDERSGPSPAEPIMLLLSNLRIPPICLLTRTECLPQKCLLLNTGPEHVAKFLSKIGSAVNSRQKNSDSRLKEMAIATSRSNLQRTEIHPVVTYPDA
jgi:hypothetical protein